MLLATIICIFSIIQFSTSLLIPQFVPDSFTSDGGIFSAAQTADGPEPNSSVFNPPDLATLGKSSQKIIARMKPFFLHVTEDNLSLGNLSSQSALKLLSQSPPFSTSNSLTSVKVAAVSALGNPNSLEPIPEALSAFLSGVDLSFLLKFHLVNEPVAAFVLEMSNTTAPEISQKKTTEFFDSLASFWNSAASLPQLLHSTFCTYSQLAANGYCMVIEGHNQIRMSTFSLLKKRGDPDEVFTPQVLRQVHNKLETVANKVGSSAEFLVDDPQAFIEDIDERVDDKIHRAEQRAIRKTHELMGIPDRINAVIDELIHRIAESRFDMDRSNEEERGSPSYYRVEKSGNSNISPEVQFYTTGTEPSHSLNKRELEDIVIPISLLLVGKTIPRPKEYASVFSTAPRLAKRDEECVPVTWNNLVHHSVFGDYKFCP